MYRSFVEDSVYKHRGSRLSSQTPANKDYSRWPYSFEIREVLRDTLMTFFSLRSRRLEVVGAERARERETISRVVYKASCWDCQDFYYTDKTKQRLHDRKTEHFKYETLACIAGGILLPGVLFWRRSSHTRRAVKLQGNTHLNTHSSHGPAAKTIQHSHANPTSYACRLL